MGGIMEFKKIISQHRKELENRFNVEKIGLFGSYVRGEESEESDLDILVEFKEPISLFEFMELEEYLEEILKIKVDVVSKKGLNPYIGEQILNEVVYV
ncbi:MAG: nucleotidyltransferase family protein [Candidatus Odinarchaeota archaeon]